MTPRGFSSLELAMLVAVIAAALLAMGVFISRGYQGGLRQAAMTISPTPYIAGSAAGTTTLTTVSHRIEQPGSDSGQLKDTQTTQVTSDETITIDRNETVHF